MSYTNIIHNMNQQAIKVISFWKRNLDQIAVKLFKSFFQVAARRKGKTTEKDKNKGNTKRKEIWRKNTASTFANSSSIGSNFLRTSNRLKYLFYFDLV